MKKKLFFVFFILLSIQSWSQYSLTTVYTRMNTPVEAGILIGPDHSTIDINYIKSQTSSTYPSATILADPTKTYNCHGYAWDFTEGALSHVWINEYDSYSNPNVYKYFTDGSFIQVCNESDAEKIHYYNGDHSAVKSTVVNGKYESKWGNECLMRHDPTVVPSIYNASYRNYYVSTKITGDVNTRLCTGTKTFSVKSFTGGSYSWTCSSNVTIVGSSTSNQVSVQRYGTLNGDAWAEVTISSSCSTSPVTQRIDFKIGTPGVDFVLVNAGNVDPLSLCPNTNYSFVVNPSTYGQYEWYLPNNWTTTNTNSGPNPWICYDYQLDLQTDSYSSGTVSVRKIDGCGYGDFTYFETALNCAYYSYAISPNPTTSQVTIDGKSKKQIKEVQLLDRMGVTRKIAKYNGETKVTFNTSGLPMGIYILKIYDGKNWTVKQLSIQ